jgi:hypothetical protein
MARRKGELSAVAVDRAYPHQVALRADLCGGSNYDLVEEFCKDLSLAPRGHSVRRNDVDYVVFCFADKEHASLFSERFGGEPFNPKDRGRGSNWRVWRQRSSRVQS